MGISGFDVEYCAAVAEDLDAHSFLGGGSAEVIGPAYETGCGGCVDEVDVFFHRDGETVERSDGRPGLDHVGVEFCGMGEGARVHGPGETVCLVFVLLVFSSPFSYTVRKSLRCLKE